MWHGRMGAGALVMIAAVLAIAWWAPGTPGSQMTAKPVDGWALHIDAKLHFPGNGNTIAHHYCKAVAGGLTECLLFDSDRPDARLVGVEVVVPAATYQKFSAGEKRMWHYHKTEIPKVSATLPDLSPEEAARVAKSLEETYGKIYLLWDPTRQTLPTGNPSVTILK